MLLHILLFLSSFNLHDHHVSVCDIVYNPESGSLEVIQSVIADDFEKALKITFNQKDIDLLSEEKQEENNELIQKYFEENFKIYQNGELLALTWIGFEIIDNDLRAYFEYEALSGVNNLTLADRVLIDQFRKQQNMVHWKFGSDLKTTVLSKKETVVELVP